MVPYIQCSSIAAQLELEFLHHMQMRYRNDFSYEFLDLIQDKYRCCDTGYYHINYDRQLPTSCFRRDSPLTSSHKETCPKVLSDLVCARLIIVSLCLFIMLISLIALGVIRIFQLLGRDYDVAAQEANEFRRTLNEPAEIEEKLLLRRATLDHRRPTTPEDMTERVDLKYGDYETDLVDDISERLKLEEKERDIPVVIGESSQPTSKTGERTIWNYNGDLRSDRSRLRSPVQRKPILTRANFTQQARPQSPIIVTSGKAAEKDDDFPASMGHEDSTSMKSINSMSPKSALRKSVSTVRFDSDEEEIETVEEIQRHTQTRRSLLNVRFAE